MSGWWLSGALAVAFTGGYGFGAAVFAVRLGRALKRLGEITEGGEA